MRRAPLAWTALLALACARPLDVPPSPAAPSEVEPVVQEVFPDVAVGALGSPVFVRGQGLAEAGLVQVGPIRYERAKGDFTVRRGKTTEGAAADELLLHVTRPRLKDANIPDADGERHPVRVTVNGAAADALGTVRVYARRPSVQDLMPRDLAAGTLFSINGRGFDADDFEMNDVAFPPGPGVECWSGRGRTNRCKHAEVFWAARGIVMAVTPDGLAPGAVRLVYRNRRMEQLVFAAEAWAGEGRPLSQFFGGIDYEETGISPAAVAAASAETVATWATTSEIDNKIGDFVVAWEDPGPLTIEARVAATVTVRSERALCFPLLVATKRLEVFVDGAPIAPAAIACAGDKGLKLELPAAVLARPAIPHAVQVQNPRFTSPVAFFTLN